MNTRQDCASNICALQLKCRQVPSLELLVPSVEVRNFGARLIELCRAMCPVMLEDAGIGLAAPQIGYNLKLVILDSKAHLLNDGRSLERARFVIEGRELYTLVNPKITYYSPEQVDLWNGEGCLSLLGAKLGKVTRSRVIRVEYQNIRGEVIEGEFQDKLATVVQHEMDHLYGILYPARMKEGERNSLMVDYLRRKKLNQMDLIRFSNLMQDNLFQYARNSSVNASTGTYGTQELTEFATKVGLAKHEVESMLSSINYVNHTL